MMQVYWLVVIISTPTGVAEVATIECRQQEASRLVDARVTNPSRVSRVECQD